VDAVLQNIGTISKDFKTMPKDESCQMYDALWPLEGGLKDDIKYFVEFI
jgi:hypothetical protein